MSELTIAPIQISLYANNSHSQTFHHSSDRGHQPVTVAKVGSLYSTAPWEGVEEMERGGVALSEHWKVFAKIVLQRCGRGRRAVNSGTGLIWRPLGQKCK